MKFVDFSPAGYLLPLQIRFIYTENLLLRFIIFLVTQMVKNMPVMQETWVQSLSREDPLEKEMTTHSSILAWEILWTEELGGP